MQLANIFKIIFALVISIIMLGSNIATAQDNKIDKGKSYSFTFSGYVSKTIDDQEDFAMLKAAQYSLKKGYSHFTIVNSDRYDNTARRANRTTKFGRKPSKRPRLKTKLTILCFNHAMGENSHDAKMIVASIKKNTLVNSILSFAIFNA